MSHKSLLQAPARYDTLPANADLAYDTICKVLSDRQEQVNWDAFTPRRLESTLPRMAKAEGVAPLMHWKMGRTDDGGRNFRQRCSNP